MSIHNFLSSLLVVKEHVARVLPLLLHPSDAGRSSRRLSMLWIFVARTRNLDTLQCILLMIRKRLYLLRVVNRGISIVHKKHVYKHVLIIMIGAVVVVISQSRLALANVLRLRCHRWLKKWYGLLKNILHLIGSLIYCDIDVRCRGSTHRVAVCSRTITGGTLLCLGYYIWKSVLIHSIDNLYWIGIHLLEFTWLMSLAQPHLVA